MAEKRVLKPIWPDVCPWEGREPTVHEVFVVMDVGRWQLPADFNIDEDIISMPEWLVEACEKITGITANVVGGRPEPMEREQ